MNWKKYVLACGLLLLATGCLTHRKMHILKELYPEQWPLTVPGGYLTCAHFMGIGKTIVFYDDKYQYYVGPKSEPPEGYRSINLIVKPDPTNPRKKMDIGVVREEGLRLCKQY